MFWLQGATLFVLSCAVYWPTLGNGFIWDDDDYVQNNMTLASPAGLRNIWFKLGAVPQYYPLVHSTFWIEYRLWGLNPRGYHLVNLLLHALSAVLVWRLLVRLAVPGGLAGRRGVRRPPGGCRKRGLGDGTKERAVVCAGARIDAGLFAVFARRDC